MKTPFSTSEKPQQPIGVGQSISRRELLSGSLATVAGLATGVIIGHDVLTILAHKNQAPDQAMTYEAGDSDSRQEISFERAQQLKAWVLGATSTVFEREGYQGPRQSDTLTTQMADEQTAVTITLDYEPTARAHIGDTNPDTLRGFALRYHSLKNIGDTVESPDAATGVTTSIQGTVLAPVRYQVALRSESDLVEKIPMDAVASAPSAERYYLVLSPGSELADVTPKLNSDGLPTKPPATQELMDIGLQTFATIAKQS